MTTILDLPNEVLALIFSFVEPLEAVKNLPRVCPRFKAIVHDRVPWKHLDLVIPLDDYYRLLPSVKAVFRAGHFEAEYVHIGIRGVHDEILYGMENVVLKSFLQMGWTKLRRAVLPLWKGVRKLVTVAPELVELKLFSSKQHEPLMWEEVAALAAHASLKKIFILSDDFGWPRSLNYNEVLVPLLAKLESFILLPSVGYHGNPRPRPDRQHLVINLGQNLKNLKDIQITAQMCTSAVRNQPDLRNVNTLSYPTVERLSLTSMSFGEDFVFGASFLVPFVSLTELRFDHVTSGVFRQSLGHLSSQSMAVLRQVTKLEITVHSEGRFDMAPLPSMVSLKWLFLKMDSTGSYHSTRRQEMYAVEALKALKTLVNLEGLELRGLNSRVRLADKCATEVFPEWACDENLTWLAFRDMQKKPHEPSTFSQIIDKFPNLEHLSFKTSKPSKNPGMLITRLISRLRNVFSLLSLWLC